MAEAPNLLKQAFQKCLPRLTIVIFFSLFINLLMFVAPLHMLQIYDRVLVSRSEVTLVVLTGLAIGLLVVYGLLEGVRSKILVRIGLKFDELVSNRMFNIVFETTLRHPGASSSQALRDVDSVRDFVSGGAVIALCDAPWVPIFIAACFILHPILGFVALTGAILVFVLAAINEWLTRTNLSQANQLTIQASNEALSSLRNAEIVKALGMIPAIKDKWTKSRDAALNHHSVASDRAGGIVASSRFVRMGLQVTILATGGYLAIQDQITPGTMIAASIIMGRALAPVELAVSQWRNFVAARDAYARLTGIVETQPANVDTMDLPMPTGKVDLQNLFVRPPDSENVIIANVSLNFQPGRITGIIGPSGCGKSTLVRAIVGVWPSFRGSVRYDGASIDNWKPEKLGPNIGYMPQDVELFSGSVAQNISRFQDLEPEAVVSAAKKAGVHELILQFPNGYDTNIGIGGHALSGGQRQRVALARALYKNPKVIVLDEPNSNLDAEGEKALAESITQARETGATVIVVSHRPSLLAVVDNIAVLNKGAIVKMGPRDQILSELGGGRVTAGATPPPANN
ncbi:type I secretion system permease/ATPase [Rhodospirillaceae bacterium]|nr:type I secretion system permease/ATPase [Rhodospirillaceae bacterium]